MTIHWPRPLPGWVLFGLLMIFFLCSVFIPTGIRPLPNYEYESLSGNDDQPYVNDTLPHYRYQRIKDSLNLINRKSDYFFEKGNSGIEFNNVGFANYSTEPSEDYFLTISGYNHDDNVSVKNKSDRSILLYPVWDKIENHSRSGHLEAKPIQIKYEEGKERWQGKVFVPVAKTFGSVLTVVFYIFIVVIAIVCFYCILFVPLRFLYQLAKGKAFTEENIGNLYFTGWGLIAIGLLLTLTTFFAHVLVRYKIPDELTFSYYAVFMDSGKYFMSGLAVLLLAKAFLQGLELKEESDLTV